MKQMNMSRSSFLKEEPTANNIYDNQISRLLQRPLRMNTLTNSSKSTKNRQNHLIEMVMDSVSDYHLDDSSDEEDNY